jgi:GT2 family glycosyltransferase
VIIRPSNKVVACLTSHNRCASTLACLTQLRQAAEGAGVRLLAVLADDGSTDGTGERVAEMFPWVTVLKGNGSLFWNRGMHLAMEYALDHVDADFVLWLNDDTLLNPDSIARLLAARSVLLERKGRDGIVVGATADHSTGRLTYSGMVSAGGLRPLAFRKVYSETELVSCDTMNGNVVLIPISVARSVGNLDPVFEHSMGDVDYGLRARREGHPLAVAPGIVGVCSCNPVAGSFLDTSLPVGRRWKLFVNRKVLPPKSWKHLVRRHSGSLWPLLFAWPYAAFWLKAVWAGRPRLGRARF